MLIVSDNQFYLESCSNQVGGMELELEIAAKEMKTFSALFYWKRFREIIFSSFTFKLLMMSQFAKSQ